MEHGNLVIDDVIPEDAGTYTCVASNVIGEMHNSTSVIVFRKSLT